MALFRCNKCGHLREVVNDYIGKSVKCPKCNEVASVYDTVSFVKTVIGKYREKSKELHALKQHYAAEEITEFEICEEPVLDNIDIYNTTALAQRDQYEAIIKWFEKNQIQVEVNPKAIDTTGFFDEVAMHLGDRYDSLVDIVDQMKRIQRKGYTNVKFSLTSKNQKQIREITRFCQQLYDYSFVAKYYYHKQDKFIRLTLQTAPAIVNFFNGEWLEWYVFMKLLEFSKEKHLKISFARNLVVKFPNEDSHELDVFLLVDDQFPICIECKSGEFRKDIGKYCTLRKRLKIDEKQFLLSVVGLSEEQAQGLTSMYDVTFVNENTFLDHVENLV